MVLDYDLSHAHEDYLEAMYLLSEDATEDGIKSVDIAHQLDVSKASVNKALNVLKDAGYVEQEHYGKIMLTPKGEAYGREVLERHRLLRSFLIHQLGVDPEIANDEACEMEHAISKETVNKWIAYLKRCGDCEKNREFLSKIQNAPDEQ